jgi:hypothetical protein
MRLSVAGSIAFVWRALWSLGRKDAAIATARKAESELAGNGDGARDLAQLRVWLKRHAARGPLE